MQTVGHECRLTDLPASNFQKSVSLEMLACTWGLALRGAPKCSSQEDYRYFLFVDGGWSDDTFSFLEDTVLLAEILWMRIWAVGSHWCELSYWYPAFSSFLHPPVSHVVPCNHIWENDIEALCSLGVMGPDFATSSFSLVSFLSASKTSTKKKHSCFCLTKNDHSRGRQTRNKLCLIISIFNQWSKWIGLLMNSAYSTWAADTPDSVEVNILAWWTSGWKLSPCLLLIVKITMMTGF